MGFLVNTKSSRNFPVGPAVKNLPAKWESRVRSLGREDLLKKGVASHSSVLACEIQQTEEPGGYGPWGGKEWGRTERLDNHKEPQRWKAAGDSSSRG